MFPVTIAPSRSRDVIVASEASSIHPSRQEPDSSPRSGLKWSNVHPPTKTSISSASTQTSRIDCQSLCICAVLNDTFIGAFLLANGNELTP